MFCNLAEISEDKLTFKIFRYVSVRILCYMSIANVYRDLFGRDGNDVSSRALPPPRKLLVIKDPEKTELELVLIELAFT